MSLRRLLVLVALLSLPLALAGWLARRSAGFRARADAHLDAWLVEVGVDADRAEFHAGEARRWRRAAERPWASAGGE